MMKRTLISATLVLIGLAGPVFGQFGGPDILGFVTVQTGDGATRGLEGSAFDARMESFSDATHGVSVGDEVATNRDATAVVTLPEYGSIVQLDSSTLMTLSEDRLGGMGFPATVSVSEGSLTVLRKSSDDRWMVVSGVNRRGAGFVLFRKGSIRLTVDRRDISCLAMLGEVIWFDGELPDGPIVDADGDITLEGGTNVPAGSRVSARLEDERVSADPAAIGTTYAGLLNSIDEFGVDQSGLWVERAEQGDFTPVRGSSRAAAEAFSSEIGVSQSAFDQPRSVVVAPAPAVRTVTVRTTSPSQTLIESGVPSNVVIGQRLRRSRIIGSPGTTGLGLRFNPNAEQLIRLTGGSR